MITGKDTVSLAIYDALNRNEHPKDIMNLYQVTSAQMSRLKRFYKYRERLRKHTDESTFEAFCTLGLKALVLAPLFKKNDYEGLSSVLAIAEEGTTQTILKSLMEKWLVKQTQVQEFMEKHRQLTERTADFLQEHALAITQLNAAKQDLLASQLFVQDYPETAREFLADYVALHEGEFILRRRLDSGFRQALNKKGIIQLNKEQFIWRITDLERFVEQYLYRAKRNFHIYWDYERELKRGENSIWPVARDEYYAAAHQYQLSLNEIDRSIKETKEKMQQMNAELQEHEQTLKALQQKSIQSFELAAIVTNELSERELIAHATLQTQIMKWIYAQGGIACSELTLPNKRRADVVGYLPNGDVLIFEVKVNYADFMRDSKWEDYLPYCDKLYFACDFFIDEERIAAGLVTPYRQSVKLIKEDTLKHACKDSEGIKHRIHRHLAQRYIYGFK